MMSKLGDCPGRPCIFHGHEALRSFSQCTLDIPLDAGSGSDGLEATMPAAATQQPPVDHGKVPYLTCKTVTTNIQMPVHNERSSNTSPDREHHDIAVADGDPADPLGEERTVGIVFQIRRGTGEPTDDISKRHISHAGH